MLNRTKDSKVVGEILQPYLPFHGASWEDTLEDDDNIFLVSEDNLALFELDRKGVYLGHYFFNSARGRDAVALSLEALRIMFEKAEVIQGWTPIEHKAALNLSFRLGFKSYGTIETSAGPMVLFIMTKNEWKGLHE